MKAKEYFKEFFEPLPKHNTSVNLLLSRVDQCFRKFMAEAVESAKDMKQLQSQVIKFKENDKKWRSLVTMIGNHLTIPDLYRRISGDASGLVDSNDIKIITEFFSDYVCGKWPQIWRELRVNYVASDRLEVHQRPKNSSSADCDRRNGMLELRNFLHSQLISQG